MDSEYLQSLLERLAVVEAKVLAMEARLNVASMTEPEKIALIAKCAKYEKSGVD